MINSCKNMIKRKVVGSDVIEAHYIDDTTVEGVAKYYNKNGTLLYSGTFHNHLKEGAEVHYYPNGVIRDSAFYVNDLVNGFSYGYDSLGKLSIEENHYYGLLVGDRVYFKSGELEEYFFSDFDQNDIFKCDYDFLGKCKLVGFKLDARLTYRLGGNAKPALGVFLYFPKPPNLTITQTIGLRNAKMEIKDERLLEGSRLFLDTTLSYPDSGWHYFISTHIEDKKDSINKVYIQELKHD